MENDKQPNNIAGKDHVSVTLLNHMRRKKGRTKEGSKLGMQGKGEEEKRMF